MNEEFQSAFPIPRDAQMSGMSVRDYFAAQAMAALINSNVSNSVLAKVAYDLADAMLAERKRE